MTCNESKEDEEGGVQNRDALCRSTTEPVPRKIAIRLPGKGKSNSHGARPVHHFISMIKWIRTIGLSIKNSLSQQLCCMSCMALGRFKALRARVAPPSMVSIFLHISIFGYTTEVLLRPATRFNTCTACKKHVWSQAGTHIGKRRG